MRRTSDETTLAARLLTLRYEPSIDELLNDPVAEAIMRYDRITRDNVIRVISQAKVRRVAVRKHTLEASGSWTGGRPTDQLREPEHIVDGAESSKPAGPLG